LIGKKKKENMSSHGQGMIPQMLKEKKENCADRIISFLLHDRHLSFSFFFH